MRTFIYDNTCKQQNDAICYAFSPDLLDASEKELKQFLSVLSQHFPKTDNGDDGFEPMENQRLLATFNSAYQNVSMLITAHREKNRHRWLLSISVLTFFVLAATLGNTFYIQCKNSNDQIQKTLKKSVQITTENK